MSAPGQPSPVADNELGVCDVRRQEVAGVAHHRFIGHERERLAARVGKEVINAFKVPEEFIGQLTVRAELAGRR